MHHAEHASRTQVRSSPRADASLPAQQPSLRQPHGATTRHGRLRRLARHAPTARSSGLSASERRKALGAARATRRSRLPTSATPRRTDHPETVEASDPTRTSSPIQAWGTSVPETVRREPDSRGCHACGCSCRLVPPRQVLHDGAVRISTLTSNPHRPETASHRLPPNRLRIHGEQVRKLARRVVALDPRAGHAVTCRVSGSDATSFRETRPSMCLISCCASSFGVSNSGHSSRNSFWSRYAWRSPSFQ